MSSNDAAGGTHTAIPVDPMSHVAARFSHALLMLSSLIPYTNDPSLERVVEIACLEDWFTNYRLLIEFLLLKPPKNCAGAQSFVPGWKPSGQDPVQRLRADYGWASEDVSHIGIPRPSGLAGNAAPEALRLRTSWVLDVADEFAEALRETGNAYADMIGLALSRARADVSSA